MKQPTTPPQPSAPNLQRRFAIAGGLLALGGALALGLLAAMGGLRLPFFGPAAPRLTDLLSRTMESGGIDAAAAQYRRLRAQGFPGLRESESDTNSLGYKLLGKDRPESAIQVFQLNVETHPGSANAYDSLAEGYLAAGDGSKAIENYQRAVALDPKMKTALAELRRLTHAERKPYPPLVLLHILAGILGILSGAAAMVLRKGSRRHSMAGRVFTVSMLSMSALAVYMASTAKDGELINILMGTFTFYLVATAWLAAQHRQGGIGPFDWGALLAALAVAAGLIRLGISGGRFAGISFLFAAVAALAAALDIRMIARGGVSGTARIVRHLWRMCAALYIAAMSFFLGQSQLFPYAARKTGLLAAPGILIILTLIFWLIRVLFTKVYARTSSPKAAPAPPELAAGAPSAG